MTFVLLKTHIEQKVMCQNMGFLILYEGNIWTYLQQI